MRVAVLILCLMVALGARAVAAAECPGNPNALGVSRTIAIDPAEHSHLGSHQYRESLPLNDHEVVLTFDDGPLPPNTNRVLDTLAAECTKATFFIVGRMATSFPQLVRRAHEEGHTIANHSQNHPLKFHKFTVDQASKERGWFCLDPHRAPRSVHGFRFLPHPRSAAPALSRGLTTAR